jgi:hypothetical protein
MASTRYLRPTGRIWWLAARRLWRQNTALLPMWAIIVAIPLYRIVHLPAEGGAAYLSFLATCATLTALLVPVRLRAWSVLESRRFDLLPLTALTRTLLRQAFGNPFRLLLVGSVWTLSAAGVLRLSLGATRTLLELVQLTGWSLAGVVAIEIAEERLRHRSSIVLNGALRAMLVASLVILVRFDQIHLWLTNGTIPIPHGVAAALLLGGRAALGWEVITLAASLLTTGALLLVARAVAHRYAACPPRERRTVTLAAPITALARALSPRSPASLAKELGHTVRALPFWLAHGWLFVVSAAATSGKNPALLSAAFFLWMSAAYNILGLDVPMGGLIRYELVPRPLSRTLAFRHAAILATGTLTALAALLVVAALGGLSGPRAADASPLAYVIWFAYGASTFLLVTTTGDWISAREPRAIGLRRIPRNGRGAGKAGSLLLLFIALGLTLAASAVLVMAWSAALSALEIGAAISGTPLLAISLATLTQFGLYALRLRISSRR